MSKKAQRWALATAVIGVAVLLALGTWQVSRLAWKTDLIASMQARMALPQAPLPEMPENPQDWVFRRVGMAGRFLPEQTVLIGPRTHEGRAGVRVFTPFLRASGGIVFVDRGWAAPEVAADLAPVAGTVFVSGIVRVPERGPFVPDNNPENGQWYWPDLGVMATGEAKAVAAIYVAADAATGTDGVVPLPVRVDLRNDHLQYALFWYGMAVILLIFYGYHRVRHR